MNRLAFTSITLSGSFVDKVAAIRAAGFDATEIWAKDLFDHLEGPEVALRILRDEGLAVSAFQAIRNLEGYEGSARRQKFDIACRIMDLACLAGSPIVTLAANVDPEASGETDVLLEDLAYAAELAEQRGLQLAYEPISWAPHIASWETAMHLIKAVNDRSFGLQLDVFHPLIQGVPLDFSVIPVEKLFLVEISDFVKNHLSPREVSRAHRLFPGEGTAPLVNVLHGLGKSGYQGDIVVEVFNRDYYDKTPKEVAMRGWQCMSNLINRLNEEEDASNEY